MPPLDVDAIDAIMLHDEEEDDAPIHTVFAFTTFGWCQAVLVNALFFCGVLLSLSGGYFRCMPIIEHFTQESNKIPFSILFAKENMSAMSKFVFLSSTVNRSGDSVGAASVGISLHVDMHRVSHSGKHSLPPASSVSVLYSFDENSVTSNSQHILTDPEIGYAKVEYMVTYANSSSTDIVGADLTVLSLDPMLNSVLSWVAVTCLMVVLGGYIFYFIASTQSERGFLPMECMLMRATTVWFIFSSDIWYIIENSNWTLLLFMVSRMFAAVLVWFHRFILFSLIKGSDVMRRKMVEPAHIILWSAAVIAEVASAVVGTIKYVENPYGDLDRTAQLLHITCVLTCVGWAVLTLWRSQVGVFLGLFCMQVSVFSLIEPILELIDAKGLACTYFRVHGIVFPALLNAFLLVITWPKTISSSTYH